MKLNMFAAWTGFAAAMVVIALCGVTLTAAGYGFGGWATVGLGAIVLSAATGATVVVATVKHDRRTHQETPHFF